MPDDHLSFDQIDTINLQAMLRLAPKMPEIDATLTVPNDDLDIFFMLSPGRKMLDVGCGTARYAVNFARAGMEYLGVDYSEPMVFHARANNPGLAFGVMNFNQLMFEDNTFDCIWACCIFGCEPKVRLPSALAELLRVLRPGGIILMILPNVYVSVDELNEESDLLGTSYSSLWYFDEFRQALIDAGMSLLIELERPECGSMTFVITKQ